MRTVSILIRLCLAVALPVLLYYSTVSLPLGDHSWRSSANNFLWIANAVYFIAYLPVKGLGFKTWVWKVLVALLAISIWITAFNGAVTVRREQYKTVNTQQ